MNPADAHRARVCMLGAVGVRASVFCYLLQKKGLRRRFGPAGRFVRLRSLTTRTYRQNSTRRGKRASSRTDPFRRPVFNQAGRLILTLVVMAPTLGAIQGSFAGPTFPRFCEPSRGRIES